MFFQTNLQLLFFSIFVFKFIYTEQTSSPLPDLPEALKNKQDTLRTLSPSPPKDARPKTPPTRAHTKGPTAPTEDSNVYGNYFCH